MAKPHGGGMSFLLLAALLFVTEPLGVLHPVLAPWMFCKPASDVPKFEHNDGSLWRLCAEMTRKALCGLAEKSTQEELLC